MADLSASESKLHSLVVIGASAGGIEALATLVATLPADFPAPIVVAQHLDPRHPSHLDEILARRSVLPVRIVTDHMPLVRGVVYVVPPDRNVEIDGHLLRLHTDGREQRPKPSINRLLSSAARAFGEQLIAVILTGTGSDGASGAHEVKAAGGMVIIENPRTAAYPGLPASLAPITVDLVADLERIGPLLFEILTGSGLPAPEATAVPTPTMEADAKEQALEEVLQTLLAHVRERSGVDFAQYKRPTILRRLQRRMAATAAADLAAYTTYIEQHPEEYHQLISSFLIKVTEFFRDPQLFAMLRDKVIPELIASARQHDNVLRIWSAGCATGEEAYSLAILVSEALGGELDQFRVQIFATDVDEDAVEFARHGIYTIAALKHLAPELIDRYFTRLDGTFQVTKRLRGLVIFGLHDLGLRAPFPHIDLVLCRNVLIYFTRELQTRALQLFAFSLRDGGYLVLGNAETVSPLSMYFEPAHPEMKLYRRHGERILGPLPNLQDLQQLMVQIPRLHRPAHHPRGAPTSAQEPPALGGARTISERLGHLVLGLSVGVVVVDRHYDIQIINRAALRLLDIYTPAVGEDLIHLAQTIPPTALRSVIDAAFRGAQGPAEMPGQPETSETPEMPLVPGHNGPVGSQDGRKEAVVTVETLLGQRRHLQIACYPCAERWGLPAAVQANETTTSTPPPPPSPPLRPAEIVAVLVVLSDVTQVVEAREQAAAAAAREQAAHQALQAREESDRERVVLQVQEENARLMAEVERQRDINRTLLEANQELADTTLSLRTINQELLVSQEEAEASTEEVKTLNEELQATNEELVTVNEELEASVEELHTANDELQARGQELQQMAASLEAQRMAGEAERAQLRAIVRSMSDAMLVVDAAGNPVLTNEAYARLFGSETTTIVPEDGKGRPLPRDARPQQRVAHGETFVMTFTLPGADGARHTYEASGQPIRTDDTVSGGVIIFRAI